MTFNQKTTKDRKTPRSTMTVLLVVAIGLCFYSRSAYADTTTYSITYYENTVTNMPDNESGLGTSTDMIALSSITPSRSGFQFGGWCNTVTIKDANGYDTCSGATYLPGANNFPINNGISFNTKLYAIWEKTTQSSCSSSPMISTVASGITYMQDINSSNKASILSALTTGDTYQIKDNRDNETYCVGKLADGKLWLLDNLALDLTNSTVLDGMNENNTNASNTTLGYLKNGGGTASDKYAISGVVNWTDSPTYASDYSCSDPLVNLTNKDTVPSDATSQAGQYRIGGYYNYCAASAGSYCYGNGTSSGTSSGNTTEDICPKGWRMPTGNTSGEYSALANAIYGSTGSTYDATAEASYRSALRLPFSGYFYCGSADDQGSFGYWLSSTRHNDGNMYYLRAYTSSIAPANYSGRNAGFSVRCILGS